MSDVSARKNALHGVKPLARKAACPARRGGVIAAIVLAMSCLAVMAIGPAQARAHAQPSQNATVAEAAPPAAAARGRGQDERLAQISSDALEGMMVPRLRASPACKRPREMRRGLKRQGWWDFRGLRRAGGDFVVRARRPNGAAYQLKIDGCSGRVLGAIRMNGERRGYRVWPR